MKFHSKSPQQIFLQEIDDPFYLVDVGRLMDLYQNWVKALPAIQPYYAIKANPDPAVLKLLGALGSGFDCASKVCEYAHVQSLLLELRAQCFPYMESTELYKEGATDAVRHCA